MKNYKFVKKASIEQRIHNRHQKTTKTIGIFSAILLISCALALLPQLAQASTLTTTINVGNRVGGIAITPNGQYVYSTNSNDGTVSVISTSSNSVQATITVGQSPKGVAITPNGQEVYVTNYYGNTVSVISTATNTVTNTITGFNYPDGVAVAPDGQEVYVTNYYGNTVSVISTATNSVTSTITNLNWPEDVAVSPNGEFLYVKHTYDQNNVLFSVISTSNNSVTATITLNGYPDFQGGNGGIAVSPNGEVIYVASNDWMSGNLISVINASTSTVTTTITLGGRSFMEEGGSSCVAVSPNGKILYASSSDWNSGNSISAINTTSNTVSETTPLSGYSYYGPGSLAITPNGACVYAANGGNSNSISVLSVASTSTYIITVTQHDNGQISPGTSTVNLGDTPTFTITPNSGYHIANITVNEEPVAVTNSTGQQYQFSEISDNESISATFAINTNIITVTQGDHGTISPATTTVNYGSSQEFTITPATGYHLTDVLMNGTSVMENVQNNAYTFSNVTGATNLTATFAINTFSISVTQGDHGTISPGTTTVNYGSSQEFTITPSSGYYLADVLVNGSSVLNDVANGAYIVSDLTGTTSLTATFAIDSFAVSVTQGYYGTISPSTINVNYGGDQEFTFTPATGYHLTDVLMNGTSVLNSVDNNAFTVSNVTGRTTLTATYAIDTFSITVTQGDHGTISPATTTVNYGSSQEFTIIPATGYHISSLVVDGSAVTVASTYTFSNIQDNHSITAIFATNTLTATETTSDQTYPVEIDGNVNTEQFSNMTITPYQDTKITSVDFTLTGPSGTEGFCNLTLPKIAIPFGTNPVVYIDGIVAENQSFTEDSGNFYISFTTHFSTHQIEILFTAESNPSYIPLPIIPWAPSQTSNASPNPAIPTPTIPPTPTATPRPTTNPTLAPTTMLATLGQYATVAAAMILLGAVIIGIVQRRKHSTKTPLK